MAASSSVDRDQVQAFADTVLGDISGCVTTIMAYLGDQLGLFTSMAGAGPLTSAQIAARAGIVERYAREWLHVMVSAGYIVYDAATGRFSLPAPHAAVLADDGSLFFSGGTLQMLVGMLDPLDLLEQAFRSGGGVPYGAYPDNMWTGMERFTARYYDHLLVQSWIPTMPVVQGLLERGARVADVGCGRGRAIIRLAQAFPNSMFVGYDVYEPTIAWATANAGAAGVGERVRFVALDAANGLPEQYDLITALDVVHDSPDPLRLLRAIRAALHPDGRFVCLDAQCTERLEDNTGPLNTVRYGFSVLFCMTTSLASGGAGLGTMGLPAPLMERLCREAGFSAVRLAPITTPQHVFEATP